MRSARVAAFAALSSLVLFAPAAEAADSCWYPNEAKAAQLRDFHLMLMVGTLQCRNNDVYAVKRYNDFVTKQRGILDANFQVLKVHFSRESVTGQGQRDYDAFATSLANKNSSRSQDPGYCDSIDSLVRMATDASQPDLLVLAETMTEPPVSGLCTPSNYAVYEPGAADAADVAEAPLVTANAPAPEPIALKSLAPPPQTAAAPISKEAALQAAIAALQTATLALQAATESASAAETGASEAKPATIKADMVADAPIVPPQEPTIP
jgi:hypothetical protein